MPHVEWDLEHTLTSPQGTLPLNVLDEETGGRYIIIRRHCSALPTLRVVTDDIPQADGSIPHSSFKSGLQVRLGLQLWLDPGQEDLPATDPACRGDLRAMWDRLMLHLEAMLRPAEADLGSGNCRLQWTPSEYPDDRIFDRLTVIEWPTPSFDEDEGVVAVTFGFRTPLPYALDLTQVTTSIANAGSETITNPGTSRYYPVFKVNGAASAFTIINETTGKQLGYDAGLPGGASIAGGEYAEIATFKETVYLNGDVANLKPGIDLDNSDFFPLEVGDNVITYAGDGGSVDVLWNPAWA